MNVYATFDFDEDVEIIEQEKMLDEIEAILKKYCGSKYYIKVKD